MFVSNLHTLLIFFFFLMFWDPKQCTSHSAEVTFYKGDIQFEIKVPLPGTLFQQYFGSSVVDRNYLFARSTILFLEGQKTYWKTKCWNRTYSGGVKYTFWRSGSSSQYVNMDLPLIPLFRLSNDSHRIHGSPVTYVASQGTSMEVPGEKNRPNA